MRFFRGALIGSTSGALLWALVVATVIAIMRAVQ